jgi:hypothetical protein
VETYKCTFINKDVKGKLSVTTKYLKFESQTEGVNIKISFEHIESVTTKSKFLKGDYLIVETEKGQLVFNMASGGAEKCKDYIMSQKDQAMEVRTVPEVKEEKPIIPAATARTYRT